MSVRFAVWWFCGWLALLGLIIVGIVPLPDHEWVTLMACIHGAIMIGPLMYLGVRGRI